MVVGWAVPAGAQAPPAIPAEVMRLRQEVQVMERALEIAVQHGIRALSESLPAVSPNLLLVGGPIRARGFRLEGYGLFFDVDVPAVRRSVAWSLQTIGPNLEMAAMIAEMRQLVGQVPDAAARESLVALLEQLETDEVRTTGAAGATAAGARVPVQAADVPPSAPTPRPVDPIAIYSAELKTALLNGMLQHSGGLPLSLDEWLTVAFRSWLAPGDVTDLTTITLRAKGSDLMALREGRLSLEEAAARVEIREF
jgi:hypothetical protein